MTRMMWLFALAMALGRGVLAAEPDAGVATVEARDTVRMRLSDAVERALANSPQLAQRRALGTRCGC